MFNRVLYTPMKMVLYTPMKIQKQHPEIIYKESLLKKIRKIHTKTPVPVTCVCNFIKKETLAQVLSSEFCKIIKGTFFTGHLRATLVVDILRKGSFESFVKISRKTSTMKCNF